MSALAFLEMVQAGYTTVGEFHYLHHAPDGTPYADPDELALRVVAGARRVGIEIVLLRVAYARAGSMVGRGAGSRSCACVAPGASGWIASDGRGTPARGRPGSSIEAGPGVCGECTAN